MGNPSPTVNAVSAQPLPGPRLPLLHDEFLSAARAALAQAESKRPVAVLVVSLDDRTRLAERFGSDYVDEVADKIAEIARWNLRDADVVGRDGADRIIVVLPAASGLDARSVGDRLCAAVRTHFFSDEGNSHPTRLTISVGAAASPDHGSAYDALRSAAETARARVEAEGSDGTLVAPLAHHEALHRPLGIERFAGRKTELASLVQWLDDAVAGRPRAVIIEGEEGKGTATLVQQIKAEVRLRGGAMVSAASRDAEVREPYGVWRALLSALSRLPNAPSRDWRELHNLVPAISSQGRPRSQAGSQYRLLEELADFVRTSAANQPLVIVLDEMQWADVTSWDALDQLVAKLDGDRLMICLITRPDTLPATTQRIESLAKHENARRLTLSALTRDEVKQWLEAAFHGQKVAREFLAFLYRHTEGNPFFIAQLLYALVEDGKLWYTDGRWEWSPVSELRFPAGVSALIAKRVNRFSSSTQAVLSIASVVGREFDVALLAAAGAGSEPAVKLALSEALTAGLVRRTFDRNRSGFAFVHDQIAAVLFDLISRERRRQLHRQVAQALERRPANSAGDIATHHDRAGDSAPAYRYAQIAAEDAEHVYAFAAATGYLQMAARNSTTPGELAEARVKLAHLAETSGRFDEVEELCDLAIEWFEGQAETTRALSLRRMRERARIQLGQPARVALDELMALEAQAKELGLDRERASVLALAAQVYGRLGDVRTAERLAIECVDMAESIGDPSLLGDALMRLGSTVLSESPGRALTSYRRALEIFEATGDVRGQAWSHVNIGAASQFENRIDEAARAFERCMVVARAAGIPDVWGVGAMNLGVLLMRAGNYDRARELLGDALAAFATVKHSQYQLHALYNMAHVERELGLWDSALKLYEATSPLAQRIGQSDIEIGAIAGLALCNLDLGRMDDARALGRTLQERIDSRPDWFQGRELVEAFFIRISIIEADFTRAVERLEAALPLAETMDVYSAVWLVAASAEAVAESNRPKMRPMIERYALRVSELGYPEMRRRYEVLLEA
jgi:diguanylate cyclase (GGDEF)-like protein